MHDKQGPKDIIYNYDCMYMETAQKCLGSLVEDAPTNKIKHNQIESDRECSPIFPCKLLGSLWCRMFS